MKKSLYWEDESELIVRLQHGDHEAFAILYARYRPLLYSFVRQLQLLPDQAEEVVQATFEKLWESRERLIPYKGIQSYLFQIGKHLIYNEVRRNAVREKYISLLSSKEEYDEPTLHRELETLIQESIDKLSPKRRAVFQMSRIQGYSIPQIADELGLSRSTVENHLHAALKFLREQLERQGYLISFLLINNVLSYT